MPDVTVFSAAPVRQGHLDRARTVVGPGGVLLYADHELAATEVGAIERGAPVELLDRDDLALHERALRTLASVGALRDWIKDIGRDATWRIAIASVFWCVSTQVPLPNDTRSRGSCCTRPADIDAGA